MAPSPTPGQRDWAGIVMATQPVSQNTALRGLSRMRDITQVVTDNTLGHGSAQHLGSGEILTSLTLGRSPNKLMAGGQASATM